MSGIEAIKTTCQHYYRAGSCKDIHCLALIVVIFVSVIEDNGICTVFRSTVDTPSRATVNTGFRQILAVAEVHPNGYSFDMSMNFAARNSSSSIEVEKKKVGGNKLDLRSWSIVHYVLEVQCGNLGGARFYVILCKSIPTLINIDHLT